MKAVFPSGATSRLAWGCNSAGPAESRENCQVGVFLSYVTARGHTLIDRELYLPLDWLEDPARCRAAHIPESVRFQTKPELAVQMLERIWHAQIPIAWVVADTVYGANLDLRNWCERHQYSYVLAVACDEPVGIVTADGERSRVEVALPHMESDFAFFTKHPLCRSCLRFQPTYQFPNFPSPRRPKAPRMR